MTQAVAPLSDVAEIAVVGLGLIGGSVARGLRAAGYRGRLVGAVETDTDVAKSLELEIVDGCFANIECAVASADLIVVATPPSIMPTVFAALARHKRDAAVVTDTASSKSGVIAAARAAFGAEGLARFVPGHPIAGTEHNGLEAGFPSLFRNRRVILTPTGSEAGHVLTRVETLWKALGAQVVKMDAGHHDDVLAATSHLPHVLAYTLVDMLADRAERTEIFAFAAGGFSDFTRIASSNPALWRSIVSANREPVLQMIDDFIQHLQKVRKMIDAKDEKRLEEVFCRAKSTRDDFVLGCQEGHDARR